MNADEIKAELEARDEARRRVLQEAVGVGEISGEEYERMIK